MSSFRSWLGRESGIPSTSKRASSQPEPWIQEPFSYARPRCISWPTQPGGTHGPGSQAAASSRCADPLTAGMSAAGPHQVASGSNPNSSAATRQAALEAAGRRERAAAMRREALRTDLGEPDGDNVADELARGRSGER